MSSHRDVAGSRPFHQRIRTECQGRAADGARRAVSTSMIAIFWPVVYAAVKVELEIQIRGGLIEPLDEDLPW